ncbi:MAG TPA: DNA polymerase III subunit delta [Gemmatimonadaceae bacterium]
MATDAALKTLRDAVKARHFDGAYYVYGEDEYQKNEAVKQLVTAAIDPATRDFNLDTRRGAELDAESLDSLLGTPPMMAERRVTIIREVGALKKDARAALDMFLRHPSHDTTVILVAAPGAKADKALQMSTTAMEFNLLDGSRVSRWIVHHVTSELGTEITEGAADLLHEAVGNDLYQLASELDKLASYTNGACITEDSVSAAVGIRRGETIADFLDKVMQRDATGALGLIPHILSQPKTSGVSVVMALSTQMLALGWGRSRLDTGLPPGRLEGEYFQLLKSTGAYPARPWGGAARAWALAARDWKVAECDRAVVALLAADVALKESRVSSESQILATAVLAICSASGRRRAA